MVQKVDSFTYTVEPFDDDFTGRLSWAVLGKHVLACAENHAGARGFDRLEKDGHRYLWVLSRIVFEMDEWPRRGERYTISTWIRQYYRYFTDRCFDVADANGKIIGRVFTIWAMIDAETRRPQVLEGLFGHTFDPFIEMDRPCDVRPFSRIRVNKEQAAETRHTYYSDIDENNHVNSIRYIEFILDAFPKSSFEGREVSRIELAYNSETFCGDTLQFFMEQAEDNDWHVLVRKNTGETVCHSAVTFKNTKTDNNQK